jgi:hypothetical protein
MEWILTKPVVIGFALLGGVLSVAAIFIRKRQANLQFAAKLDTAAYALMGVSMLLFIIIGLRGKEG